jgi:hypothetical protein
MLELATTQIAPAAAIQTKRDNGEIRRGRRRIGFVPSARES